MAKLKQESSIAPSNLVKKEVAKITKQSQKELSELQRIFSAQKQYGLLVVIQGMDASGKDGVIRKAFSKFNPSDLVVHSFKKPTEEEFAHDFLWRINKKLPKKGQIVVFNRSHYEDILVPTVHGYLDSKIVDNRYEAINQFEQNLLNGNFRLLKIFLNVSKNKQAERLQERLDLTHKFWKHNDNDWKTREQWGEFMNVYENIFEKCSTPKWNIVPADQNWYKAHVVTNLLLEEFKSMDLQWPKLETTAKT